MATKIGGVLLFLFTLILGYVSGPHAHLPEESLTISSEAPAVAFTSLDSALKYSRHLRYRLPDFWPRQLQSEITDVIKYVGNKKTSHELHMDPRMLEGGPLEVLGALFHKARHSSSDDPGHVDCFKGDLANYPGGCDPEFTLDLKKAGAYVYSVMYSFALALYSDSLTEGQREWALQSGLAYLSTRFNNLDRSLTEFQDILALVDTHNRIFFYDPQSGNLKEFKYKAPGKESISRVDFSALTGGLLFYTESGRLYTWSFYDKSNSLRPFLKKQSQDIGAPEPKIFFQGLSGDNVMLDRNGRIFFTPHFATGKPFQQFEILNHKQWSFGTGGAYSDGLYLIDEDGRLESFRAEFTGEDDDGSMAIREVIKDEDSILMPDRIRRYLQGIHHEAVLGRNGKVYVRKRDSFGATWTDAHTLSIPDLKTIIMLRKMKTPFLGPK